MKNISYLYPEKNLHLQILEDFKEVQERSYKCYEPEEEYTDADLYERIETIE